MSEKGQVSTEFPLNGGVGEAGGSHLPLPPLPQSTRKASLSPLPSHMYEAYRPTLVREVK